MELKCEINNKVYTLIQGSTFSEEYNETLDSGAIILSQEERITNMKQFDVVHVFDTEHTDFEQSSDIITITDNTFKFLSKENIANVQLVASRIEKNIQNTDYVALFNSVEDGNNFISFEPAIENGNIRIQKKYYEIKNNVLQLGRPATAYDVYLIKFDSALVYTEVNAPINKINSNEDNLSFMDFYAYYNYELKKYVFTDKIVNGKIVVSYYKKSFNKRFIISNYTETQIMRTHSYQYTINLMSETKLLEGILCPNLTITQKVNPFTHEFENVQRSVADYMVMYTDLYAPKIKIPEKDKTNIFIKVPKYSFDTKSREWSKLSKTNCPEMSFGNQNLREVLQSLANVCDFLPYVENNVIKFKNLAEPTSLFDDTYCNSIECAHMNDDYMNGTRVSFKDAVNTSQLTYQTKEIGFRDSQNVSINSLENLKIEFKGQKIYKVEKFVIKYLKKVQYLNDDGSVYDKTEWIRQDITKLLLHNNIRNLLNPRKDFFENRTIKTEFSDGQTINNLQEMSNYKYLTLGYDIGGSEITGFSDVYEVPYQNWLSADKNEKHSNLETILDYLNYLYPLGNTSEIDFAKVNFSSNIFRKLYTEDCKLGNIITYGEDFFKGLVFEIAYYSLNEFDMDFFKQEEITNEATDYMRRDNQNNSLAVLDTYSSNEQAKINRFGNKEFNFRARVKSYEEVNNVGSYYPAEDLIVYHREMSVFEHFIVCNYKGTRKYLLKDYYTSLSAKHRVYSVASYEESVTRNEVRNFFIEISKTPYSIQDIDFKSFDSEEYLMFLSGIKPHPLNKIGEPGGIYNFNLLKEVYLNTIDLFYMESTYKDGDVVNGDFSTEKGKFTLEQTNIGVKNYMVFNFNIPDNYSLGSYVKNSKAFDVWSYILNIAKDAPNIYIGNNNDLYSKDKIIKGSIQSYYQYADYYGEYGLKSSRKEPISLKFAKSNYLRPLNSEEEYKKYIFNKPLLANEEINRDIFAYEDKNILKDNKEKLNYSLEFSYYTRDNNIFIGEYFAKLNDLVNRDNALIKNVDGDYNFINPSPLGTKDSVKLFVTSNYGNGTGELKISLLKNVVSQMEIGVEYNLTNYIGYVAYWSSLKKVIDLVSHQFERWTNPYIAIFNKIKKIDANTVEIYSDKTAQDFMFLQNEIKTGDPITFPNTGVHFKGKALQLIKEKTLKEFDKFNGNDIHEYYIFNKETFFKGICTLRNKEKSDFFEGTVMNINELVSPPHPFIWNSESSIKNIFNEKICGVQLLESDKKNINNVMLNFRTNNNMYYVRLDRCISKTEAENLGKIIESYQFKQMNREMFIGTMPTEDIDFKISIENRLFSGTDRIWQIPSINFYNIKNPTQEGFIGVYYYYKGEYNLIFGFNHLVEENSEIFYGNIKDSKNDLVYKNRLNQQVIGKVAEFDEKNFNNEKNQFVFIDK